MYSQTLRESFFRQLWLAGSLKNVQQGRRFFIPRRRIYKENIFLTKWDPTWPGRDEKRPCFVNVTKKL